MTLADKLLEGRSEPRQIKAPAYGYYVKLDGKLLLWIGTVVLLCVGILIFSLKTIVEVM